MLFSKTFIPTAREAQKNITDPSVACLSRAGYLTADQETRTLRLLPLGFLLWQRVISDALDLAREEGLQVAGFEDVPEDAMTVSRKLLKSYRQLPLTFFSGDMKRWIASGLAPDPGSAGDMRDRFLEMAGTLCRHAGLDPRSGETIKDGRKYISLASSKGAWFAKEGFVCSSCSWCGDDASPAGPVERPGGEASPIKEVETPEADTIAELCSQLGVEPAATMKTMFYAAEQGGTKEVLAVLARGDHQINDRKLSHVLGGAVVRFADPLEIREAVGDLAGYLGPVGLPKGIKVLADRHVEGSQGLVAGANKPGFHLLNVCWGRDFSPSVVADLVSIQEDLPCPACGSRIVPSHLARVAVADKGSGPSELSFQGEGGTACNAYSWEGTLCITPLVLALAGGDRIPGRYAPFDVNVLIASMQNDDAVGLGNIMAERLEEKGLRVLLDERNERAGVKFSDAELLGIPVTIVAGREASEGVVEAWLPDGSRGEMPADSIIDQVLRWVR